VPRSCAWRGDATAVVVALLATLPPGMRAAVVLRYVEGLSIAEAADAMGCSEGTVKSQSARGLERPWKPTRPPG
jgi:RNA polymerase sigma factor (sigma-70 family)